MFLPTKYKPHAGHRNRPLAVTEWSSLLLHDVIYSERSDGSTQRIFFVPGHFDL